MTHNLPRLSAALLALWWVSSSQAATTYICQVDGKAAFSTVKVNSTCQASSMDGISTDVAAEKQAELKPESTEAKDNHAINQKKSQDILSSYDDVVIMPKAADMVTNSALAARTSSRATTTAQVAPPKLEIKLRKQPKTAAQVAANSKRKTAPMKTAAPIRTAAPAVVLLPPPSKPQFTRKQILQREISNEHAALARTKAQLEVVRKKGGNTTPLLQAVRDREANIRAIQGEMNKI